MRIAGLHLRSGERLRRSVASFVLGKLLKAPARADRINVPLGEDGAEPGLQRTASVEIPEERTLGALAANQTVQLRKKGIREELYGLVSGKGAERYNSEKRESARSQASAEPALRRRMAAAAA